MLQRIARFAIGLVAAVWLSGCQPLPTPPAATGQAPAALAEKRAFGKLASGNLAYVGIDGNVYVADVAAGTHSAVTSDATTRAEGDGRSYHKLAWSPDGLLAFSAFERTADAIHSQLYVTDFTNPVQMVGQSESHATIYLYWSPASCAATGTCQLAYLLDDDARVELRLVEMRGLQAAVRAKMSSTNNKGTTAFQFTNLALESGRPFYFSWSLSGEQMLWHIGGSARLNSESTLTHYNVTTDRRELLTTAPGSFMAPAWSPDGKSWLDAVHTLNGSALRHVAAGADQMINPLAAAPYDIAFSWSPSGRQIAYAVRSAPGQPYLGPLHLYDLDTGRSHQVTDDWVNVQAFFWSPDGARIAYLHWLPLQGENWIQWRIHSLADGMDRGYSTFHPSFHMQMLIGSFNQYAQSHRLWSPDGRYLVYAEQDRTLAEGIWLVDTTAPGATERILVGEGSLAIWSFR